MTNQEAITLIEEIRPKKCKMVDDRLQGGYPDHDSDIGKAIDMAIEALEKQTPKTPIKSDKEIRYCEVWKCPSCGFEWSSRVVDFCYKCGQHIDWSEA